MTVPTYRVDRSSSLVNLSCLISFVSEVRVACGSAYRVSGSAADPAARVQQVLQQQGAGCVRTGAAESGAGWAPHGV